MGKSFAEYQAEHLREPFPLPMPDGSVIPVPKASIDQDRAVLGACDAARAAGTLTPFTGMEVLVGADSAAKIAGAWGALDPDAWQAVMTDAREHFGQGNSEASPPS